MAAAFSPSSSSFPLLSLSSSRPISQNGSKSFRLAADTGNPPKISTCDEKGEGASPSIVSGENVKRVNGLSVLYDDGDGSVSVKDYFTAAKEIVRPAEVVLSCGVWRAYQGCSFALLFAWVFEVRCLHIPANDRTPFEGLLKFVENSVTQEHALSPNKPIYIVGGSFGGCLVLSVAARNPSIDLVLMLVNPATSFGKSQLQPLLPLLEAIPGEYHTTLSYILCLIIGDPVKMAMTSIGEDLPSPQTLKELSKSLTSLLPLLSVR